MHASNYVFVKPNGARRVGAGLNYGLSLNDFARGALVGCGARGAETRNASVNGRPHDVGGARNAFAGTGPPSHWRGLIFRRIRGRGKQKLA